jgi:hypothetical protein
MTEPNRTFAVASDEALVEIIFLGPESPGRHRACVNEAGRRCRFPSVRGSRTTQRDCDP